MKIYFAGSIRAGREDVELYARIIVLLGQYGRVLTEHIGDQMLTVLGDDGPNDRAIYERDMAWLAEADVFIAEITTPSLGVGYELAVVEGKKPILCFYRKQEGRKISAMISGNPHLQLHAYQELVDIEKVLKEFFRSIDVRV